jgi:outer membrane autotransporter protein
LQVSTRHSRKAISFLDGQARWDFFQNNISDTANGIFNQDFNARGFSLTGNAGYRIDLPSNWFVEPSAGILWSKVDVDPLNVSGTLVLGTGMALPGTVQIQDIDSVLGRASVRIGTNYTSGNVQCAMCSGSRFSPPACFTNLRAT